VAVAVAVLLVAVAVAVSACGGGGTKTTSASTSTAPAATSTASHPATGAKRSTTGHATAGKPSRALRAAMTAQWRRGRRAGLHACAGVARKDALAHFLAVAETAEKHHHVAVRAGMIARIKQLPKTARNGKAAPAMAAALVVSGMPVRQRAGAFAGCMTTLRVTR
jgi:hypothetical protein